MQKIVNITVFISLVLLMLMPSASKAQELGFGCLGFVGGSIGYEWRSYEAPGLNRYVDHFNDRFGDSLDAPMGHFGQASGLRFGINIVRTEIAGINFTVKGFYQALNEKKEIEVAQSDGKFRNTIEVKQNNYGVGIDIGSPLTGFLSWKIIDVSLLYNTVRFTHTLNFPSGATQVAKLKSSEGSFGYLIGSGFIWHIFDNYLSLEGFAGYSSYEVTGMEYDDGRVLPGDVNGDEPMQDFITDGGFSGLIQLNVGFPL